MTALAVRTVRLRLRAPLRAAWGALHERELVQVRLLFSDTDFGDGEAAPLEPYDGVPLAAVLAALDAYTAVLRDASPETTHEELLEACRRERPLPQALAAIDLALWDRAGRRAGRPVSELLAGAAGLGGPSPPPGASGPRPAGSAGPSPPLGAARPSPAAVPVNATIGAEDRSGAAAAAGEAVAAGFGAVKVKVGVGDDAGRLGAVRAAVGPEVVIRADANGAWTTPREALANLRVLAPLGLELCEEPVHGLEPMREVRAESPVPIALDETAAERGAARSGAADFVCLKIARCGGITGVLREAAEARTAGAAVYLASTYDGPLGIAAAVHAAAALGHLPHCGLATLDAFADLPPGPLTPRAGAIAVPDAPGLGASSLSA